jgi:diphthamide synthase (EF-2-diphthine--ammonia ligase)
VDPCGERGEFHTFVSVGPIFSRSGKSRSIRVSRGEVVERDGFVYADLLLESPIEESPQAAKA